MNSPCGLYVGQLGLPYNMAAGFPGHVQLLLIRKELRLRPYFMQGGILWSPATSGLHSIAVSLNKLNVSLHCLLLILEYLDI